MKLKIVTILKPALPVTRRSRTVARTGWRVRGACRGIRWGCWTENRRVNESDHLRLKNFLFNFLRLLPVTGASRRVRWRRGTVTGACRRIRRRRRRVRG